MADARLVDLHRLARMALEVDLAELRAAARRKEASLAALETLSQPAQATSDLSPVAVGLAALRYQRWADLRRAELNTRLAKQTAEWMEARDKAAHAFGRTEALSRLAARNAPRKPRD
ncbi:hypothetical protein U879_15930 [Defluviimonas sp. 20V17]|uniref:Uncharacterized protein n=1 Tax=Allgaiera indica TaxID=765699 RepID=A0AAN4URC4_9RHOB|nr:hypothetical protein [Allgaiera indica]KDB02682.1 hypothetical protein U879_15930 [Defluviimonas sp. 20V17]GHE01796.1 hypothetical protein GCM10008024_19000 [Allgaiera indica]SDW92884.1 hypothetical protein SAMN05444006_10846 [Allgaiera indica]